MPIFHVYAETITRRGVRIHRLLGTFDNEDNASMCIVQQPDHVRGYIVEQPERRATTYRRRKAKP